jgi:hypothetical protein
MSVRVAKGDDMGLRASSHLLSHSTQDNAPSNSRHTRFQGLEGVLILVWPAFSTDKIKLSKYFGYEYSSRRAFV